MKKFMCFCVALMMCVNLTACGNSKPTLENSIKENDEAVELTKEILAELGDADDVNEEKFEFDSANESGTKVVYSYDKAKLTLYLNSTGLESVEIKNSKDSLFGDDYINLVDALIKLSQFDMSVSTVNSIIDKIILKENEDKYIDGYKIKSSDKKITIDNVTDYGLSMSIPVTIEQIEMVGFQCLPPNSIGTIYMQTQFKNNSDKTLTGITYEYKFDNKTHYLSTYDTLLPGDTSTIADTFGPSSQNLNDAELLKANFTIEDGDTRIYVEYDAKTKKYSWY